MNSRAARFLCIVILAALFHQAGAGSAFAYWRGMVGAEQEAAADAAVAQAAAPPSSTQAAEPWLDDDDFLDFVPRLIPDPLEGWNRAVFAFNDVVIEHAAKPVYRGYEYITPAFMRSGLKNFFHNLAFPVRFTNNLLQGRGKAAGVEMSRFVLNTTAGLGGLFDVAKHHEPIVEVHDKDFGLTLGVWGAGEGFYIVWPFFGPSTVRDSVGRVGDYFLQPLTYVQPWELSLGAKALSAFNDLDEVLDLYDNLKRNAIEPYSAMRDAYVQYRRAQVLR